VRCVSSDGTVTVETIRLSGTKGRDGEWLRVKRHGYQWADVRTVAELSAVGIDLADLSEAELLARLTCRRSGLGLLRPRMLWLGVLWLRFVLAASLVLVQAPPDPGP
jgi:hypothetical protein